MIKIQVILGSTRDSRAGKTVTDWFMKSLPKTKEVSYEFIDLLEWDLPFLKESVPPMVGKKGSLLTERWKDKISEADGYIFITPEYNHGYSAVLKNAIDHAFYEWGKKPLTFVSYGGLAAGTRAVEQLIQVAVEVNLVPIRDQVNIPMIWTAFDEHGDVVDKGLTERVEKLSLQLLWWAKGLKAAREVKEAVMVK